MGAAGFGQFVGELGEHLAGGYSHGHWQAQLAEHRAAQLLPPAAEIAPIAGAVQLAEGFINRVNLQLFHPWLQGGHHALAHVGVEGVVGAAHDHPLALEGAAYLEVGRAHGDAEGPGFGTARHDAAIVVGEHHQRPAHHRRVDHRFTGGVEIVAIDQHGGPAAGWAGRRVPRGHGWRGSRPPRGNGPGRR